MQNRGFSLLELSIVLVIIGLIAGGIVAGASMIRAAELRAVITEAEHYKIAIHTFRDKYLGLPGDLKNATAFWGTMASGSCPYATGGAGTETCNGDGDGEIRHSGGAASQSNERFTFWQHLANAELITGVYTGIAGASAESDHDIGINSPSSKLSGAGWSTGFIHPISGSSWIFDGNYGNTLWLGAHQDGNFANNNPALTPTEAWNFDTKIDDGKPATGTVVVRQRNLCTNATTALADSDNFDAVYMLADEEILCALVMRNLF